MHRNGHSGRGKEREKPPSVAAMNQVSVRNLFVAASVLLLAFTPVCSAYAEIVGPAAAAVEPAPAAVETARAEARASSSGSRSARPQGEVEIVVSIPLQRAYVYRGGSLIGVTTVSTGKPGHRTPTGKFDILAEARAAFLQPLQQCADAVHAAADLGRDRAPRRPDTGPPGLARLRPAASGIRPQPVRSDVDGRLGPHHRQVAGASEALAMVKGNGNGAYTGMGGPLEEVPVGTN